MPASPTANNSGWKVTDQAPATELGRDGKAVKGMRVMFTTGKGVAADVFVPWAEYMPEAVRAAIQAKVSAIDAVHALQG